MKKTSTRFYSLFLGCVLVYLGLTFLIPPDPQTLERYSITSAQSRLLSLTVALPLIGIWFLAFYGFIRLKEYAFPIRDDRDGDALNTIANGLAVLAISLPFSSISSSIVNHLSRNNSAFLSDATIIRNYVQVALSVIAFKVIWQGTKKFSELTKKKIRLRWLPLMGVLVLGGIYVYLTFKNPIRFMPTGDSARATYYLTDPVLVTTVVFPYLYAWYIGFEAALLIGQTSKSVKGVIYKKALRWLAAGIGTVILTSIFLQIFTAISYSLVQLQLSSLLILIYVLLLIISIGYIIIALGARELKKIEEI